MVALPDDGSVMMFLTLVYDGGTASRRLRCSSCSQSAEASSAGFGQILGEDLPPGAVTVRVSRPSRSTNATAPLAARKGLGPWWRLALDSENGACQTR